MYATFNYSNSILQDVTISVTIFVDCFLNSKKNQPQRICVTKKPAFAGSFCINYFLHLVLRGHRHLAGVAFAPAFLFAWLYTFLFAQA